VKLILITYLYCLEQAWSSLEDSCTSRTNIHTLCQGMFSDNYPNHCQISFIFYLSHSTVESFPITYRNKIDLYWFIHSFIYLFILLFFCLLVCACMSACLYCWYIYCICLQTNSLEQPNMFDRQVVSQQLKALQVFETIQLLQSGILITSNIHYTLKCTH